MFEDMFDRDLFQMSSTYRDMVPEYVFPDLAHLRDEEDTSVWDDEEEVEKVETTKKRDSYYDTEEYKALKKSIDDSLVERYKYWTKFYRKHKVLNFMREFLFWVPRYHLIPFKDLRERAEKEMREEEMIKESKQSK